MNDAFDGTRWNLHLAAVQADGIQLVRSDAFWHLAEGGPPRDGVHSYGWTIMDYYAATFARYGMRWQPVLGYSAPWASSDPGGHTHAPPRDAADYASYTAAFARRYGRGGTFWDSRPDLPEIPVTTYEIWNEPNLALFWRTGPDPARYADLYAEARAAIKAVDARAQVVTGGLTAHGADDYVRAMYAARPQLRGHVDGIGLHPYSPTAPGVFRRVRSMRATLEALGEGDVPLHLTELGWVTSGERSVVRATEAERAAMIAQTTDALVRSDCGVATVIPYTWTTPQQNPDDAEDWYGIVHPDTTRTPSSEAYRRVVARYASSPPDPSRPVYVCRPPPTAVDSDGDMVPDDSDGDDDNDGVADVADAFRLDPRESADSDRDGTGDNADDDDDGDGWPDIIDAFRLDPAETADADADATGDNADTDDDGDTLSDADELARGTSRIDIDSDDDGLADGDERRTDPDRADTDRDRLPDGLELGRVTGVADPSTLVAGTDPARFVRDRDPRTRTRATARDSDRDGLADGREDRDRDGRRDRRETDPYKRDTDGDRVRDRRDRWPLDRRRR